MGGIGVIARVLPYEIDFGVRGNRETNGKTLRVNFGEYNDYDYIQPDRFMA